MSPATSWTGLAAWPTCHLSCGRPWAPSRMPARCWAFTDGLTWPLDGVWSLSLWHFWPATRFLNTTETDLSPKNILWISIEKGWSVLTSRFCWTLSKSQFLSHDCTAWESTRHGASGALLLPHCGWRLFDERSAMQPLRGTPVSAADLLLCTVKRWLSHCWQRGRWCLGVTTFFFCFFFFCHFICACLIGCLFVQLCVLFGCFFLYPGLFNLIKTWTSFVCDEICWARWMALRFDGADCQGWMWRTAWGKPSNAADDTAPWSPLFCHGGK